MKIMNAMQAYANPHFSIFALFAFLLSFVCTAQEVQQNPFMEMVGKPYAENWSQLSNDYYLFRLLDSLEEQNFIRQIEEVAQKTGSLEWQLEVEFFESLRLGKRVTSQTDSLREKYINALTILLKKTEKTSVRHLELQVRQEIIDYCSLWSPIKNYELAFELYAIQDERLRDVSSTDIPEKANYYVSYANAF